MSALDLSKNAILYARSCVPMKSDNKGYPQGHLKRPGAEAILMRDIALSNLRKAAYPIQGCTMDALIHYGRLVPQYKVGNCLEQCAAASVYLSWAVKDAHSFRLIFFAPPGDHIFIVVDQPKGDYPKDFSDWHLNAVICDPWSKIACSARDYPTKWKEKMDKWNDRGMNVAAIGMGRGASTRPGLYDAPVIYDKKPYTSD